MSIYYAAWSHEGPSGASQQDALLINHQVMQGQILQTGVLNATDGVAAVSDGLHGSPAPALASRTLLHALEQHYQRQSGASLGLRCQTLAEALIAKGRQTRRIGLSATLAAVEWQARQLRIYNVGDSRIYLRSEGHLRRLSKDHTLLQELLDRKVISSAQVEDAATFHQQPVEFFCGDPADCRIPRHYTSSLAVTHDCKVMLCTDGVTGVVSDADIYFLLSSNDPSIALECLVTTILKNDPRDNATIIILRWSADGSSD
ncbi:MAG: serine/threonine-protein phosphatase [Magnetococcales bacterium]|nr:serine/threonine-protein phosphatase [Magnetococcales bacterium]